MSRVFGRVDPLIDLIGDVYDAALDPASWNGIAQKIAHAMDAPSTALLVQPSDAPPVMLSCTDNFSDSLTREYMAYYHQHDVWAHRAAQIGLSRVYVGEDLIADDDFAETEYYRDWGRKMDAFYLVGSVLKVTDAEVAIFGIHRSRRAERFDQRDKGLLDQFLPHVTRALQLRRRLQPAAVVQGVALDVLQRTGIATLVASGQGAVIYANSDAERLLSAADGVRTVGGRLAISTRAASERLTELVRNAANTAAGEEAGAGGAVAIPRAGRLPLTVLVAPFRPAREGTGGPFPAAIIFVRDPEKPFADGAILQNLYGLTAAEAAVANALAGGQSLDEIAAGFRISLNTVRTHLKNLFAKTNTSRQAQLVAVLLRSVAILAPRGG